GVRGKLQHAAHWPDGQPRRSRARDVVVSRDLRARRQRVAELPGHSHDGDLFDRQAGKTSSVLRLQREPGHAGGGAQTRAEGELRRTFMGNSLEPVRTMPVLVWLAVLALPLAGCSAAAQEKSRVKSVEARIDGLTCPTCVPPLTNSLHQHFDKAKIEVDDEKDTATVRFDEKQAFSEAAFRQAATDVRMRVVGFR